MANFLILSAKWMPFLSWIIYLKIYTFEVMYIFVFFTELHCN